MTPRSPNLEKGHLRPDDPAVVRSEPSDHRLGKLRMARRHKAIEVGRPRTGHQLDPDLQRERDPPKRPETDAVEMAALEPRHRCIRYPSFARKVALAPAAIDPRGPQDHAEPSVIHRVQGSVDPLTR